MKNKGMLLIAAGAMLLLAETAQAQLIGGPSRISIRNPFFNSGGGFTPGRTLTGQYQRNSLRSHHRFHGGPVYARGMRTAPMGYQRRALRPTGMMRFRPTYSRGVRGVGPVYMGP